MSKIKDPKKIKYFEGLEEKSINWELPNHVQLILDRSKGIKLRHLVSRIIVHNQGNSLIVKEILQWLKDTKPQVVVKGDR
jgi:undecaprenyl pyrophosphate synthase